MISQQPEINNFIDEKIQCGYEKYQQLPELMRDSLVSKCIRDDIQTDIPDFPEYLNHKEVAELLANYTDFSSIKNAIELAQCMKEKCHKYFSNQLINQYESKYENFTRREPANENF